MCGPFSAGPEICAGDFATCGYDRVCEIDLLVELERARCKCNRAGRGSGLIDFVDDPNSNAELGEPQSEYEPCGSRADDQYLDFTRVGHFLGADNVKVGPGPRSNYLTLRV